MANTQRLPSIFCPLICVILLLTLFRYALVQIYLSEPMKRTENIMERHSPVEVTNNNAIKTRRPDVNYSSINGTKSILLWQNSWGYRFWPVGRAVFVDKACPVSNCFITFNSSYVANYNFDAFVIHPPTQKTPWKGLKRRRRDQIFILFTTEPPYHMPNLNAFENYFNWSISYRRDSDFYLSYGEITPLATAPTSLEQVTALRAQVVNANVNTARGKTKLAVWLVSNCKAPSNRQDYVAQLRKYIKVDIISQNKGCKGEDRCPRDQNGAVCYNIVESEYKFYLAFENSICDEYVTEKFFEMIGRNIIPVVLGGADYASIAPPHSYINAMDYTPHQLADYLMQLDANDTLYTEYFWWKPHYQVRNLWDTNRQVFCDLCAALHSKPLKQQTLTGLQKWYIDNAHCRNNPKFWAFHSIKQTFNKLKLIKVVTISFMFLKCDPDFNWIKKSNPSLYYLQLQNFECCIMFLGKCPSRCTFKDSERKVEAAIKIIENWSFLRKFVSVN